MRLISLNNVLLMVRLSLRSHSSKFLANSKKKHFPVFFSQMWVSLLPSLLCGNCGSQTLRIEFKVAAKKSK